MRHPKDVGDRTTIAVMHAFNLSGMTFAVPFGEEHPVRTTGRYRRVHPARAVQDRSYVGEIDDFAVFCPELGAVYLIPIGDAAARQRATLRVDRPRNNQYTNVRLAAAYELVRFDVV